MHAANATKLVAVVARFGVVVVLGADPPPPHPATRRQLANNATVDGAVPLAINRDRCALKDLVVISRVESHTRCTPGAVTAR